MHDHRHEDLDKVGRLDWHVDSVVTCVNRVQWLQTCFSCMDVEEEQLWQPHPAFAHLQQWQETWQSSFTSCPPTVAANQRCCCWPKSQEGCNACSLRCRASWLHKLALASLARGYLDIKWVWAAKSYSGVCIHGALTGQLAHKQNCICHVAVPFAISQLYSCCSNACTLCNGSWIGCLLGLTAFTLVRNVSILL